MPLVDLQTKSWSHIDAVDVAGKTHPTKWYATSKCILLVRCHGPEVLRYALPALLTSKLLC